MPALSLLNLAIDSAADGQSVSLTQDFGGTMHSITLHASQVRVLSDLMNLTGPEVDRLKRALLRANELAAKLSHSLGIVDGMGHEDLTHEVALCGRLTDFLEHVCADFAGDAEDSAAPVAPSPAPAAAPPSSARPPMPAVAPLPTRATSQQRAVFEQGRASAGELFQGAQS